MLKKIFLNLLFLLLLVSFCYSAPPDFTQESQAGTMNIAHPSFLYYPTNSNLTLHFHAYNSSGYLMTYPETGCYLHLYNKSKHILQTELVFDGNLMDYEHKIGNDFFNKTEQVIHMIVWCNNSYESGFATYDFEITKSGKATVENTPNILAIMIIQIALITFFILIGLPFKFGFAKFTSWSIALLEIVITMFMVYAVEAGGDILIFLLVNWLITLIFGGILGFMAILMTMVKLSTNDEDKSKIADDGYTKFIFK